ncbi:TIGR02996 domain-containing protein [Nannocystaceae bacterium ST9]
MRRNPELEAAILANLDDPRPWAVFADWLQGQGDPWGERIGLELMLASDTRASARANVDERLAALDRRHRVEMLGAELATLIDHDEFEQVATLHWRNGFVLAAGVGTHDDSEAITPTQVLRALLASPVACFLQRLTLGITDASYPTSLASGVAALSAGPELASLRELMLGDFAYPEQCEISWVSVGDVSALPAKYPNLRSLHLCGAAIELGDALVHPKLESLWIETGGLPARAVRAVGRCQLPELRRMEVWLGRNEYGGDGDIDMLAPLFAGEGLAKLEHLALINSEFQDDIAIALARSPILARLTSVALSMGILRDRGGRAILAAADRFRHLSAIDLDFNWLSLAMATRLEQALPTLRIGERNEPREHAEDDEDDDDEEDDDDFHYYTQVGE